MREFVNVTCQAELDRAVANGDIPVCREGFYSLYDNATARLYDNATASLYDNATARLYDNATASLYDNATASLYDNATARLYDNATAHGSKHTVIQRLAPSTTACGKGVIMDVSKPKTVEDWLKYYGVKVQCGYAVLFKGVNEKWESGLGFIYEPGAKVSCPDWSDAPCCGRGLHFSPRPFMALKYCYGPKFVACKVKVSKIVMIEGHGWPDKVKAPSCKVLHEVNEDGECVIDGGK